MQNSRFEYLNSHSSKTECHSKQWNKVSKRRRRGDIHVVIYYLLLSVPIHSCIHVAIHNTDIYNLPPSWLDGRKLKIGFLSTATSPPPPCSSQRARTTSCRLDGSLQFHICKKFPESIFNQLHRWQITLTFILLVSTFYMNVSVYT